MQLWRCLPTLNGTLMQGIDLGLNRSPAAKATSNSAGDSLDPGNRGLVQAGYAKTIILNLKYVLVVMSWHCTVLHSRLLENVFCTHCHSNHGTSHAHRMVSEHVRAVLIFSAECHLKPLSLWMIFSLAPVALTGGFSSYWTILSIS